MRIKFFLLNLFICALYMAVPLAADAQQPDVMQREISAGIYIPGYGWQGTIIDQDTGKYYDVFYDAKFNEIDCKGRLKLFGKILSHNVQGDPSCTTKSCSFTEQLFLDHYECQLEMEPGFEVVSIENMPKH